MKFEREIALLWVCIVLPYMCAVFAFVLYVLAHPGPVPRWMLLSMLIFFVLTIIAGAIAVRGKARKEAALETAEKGTLRRARAIKGLKIGLVVWGLILLNDLRMLAERTVPWTVAIPGLIIIGLLFALTWRSLRRLQKADQGQGSRQ